ncbi:MAG: PEP-CTERM sorting domain-containing protein [Terracidiphilus sp.]
MPVTAHANSITYIPNLDATVTQPGSYSFNLSGPSAQDIVLTASAGISGSDPTNDITLSTNNGASVQSLFGDPVPLLAGAVINPSTGKWTSGSSISMGSYDTVTDTSVGGPWSPGTDAFLGFSFQGTTGPPAGWAEISTDSSDSSFEVLSYAYQDQANTSILAGQTVATPEPSTIALLALGATGLMALRRRRAVTQ